MSQFGLFSQFGDLSDTIENLTHFRNQGPRANIQVLRMLSGCLFVAVVIQAMVFGNYFFVLPVVIIYIAILYFFNELYKFTE